jgi:hypothetical protein
MTQPSVRFMISKWVLFFLYPTWGAKTFSGLCAMWFWFDAGETFKAGCTREGERRRRHSGPVRDIFFIISFVVTRKPSRYIRFVKPSFDNFVRPTASFADIVSFGWSTDSFNRAKIVVRLSLARTTQWPLTLSAHIFVRSSKSAGTFSDRRSQSHIDTFSRRQDHRG